MEKLTKEQIKAPDIFIAEMSQIIDWASDHSMQIGAVAAVLFLIGAIWAGWGMVVASHESHAQDLLYQAQQLRDGVQPKDPTHASEADYRKTLDSYQKVLEQYPGTHAAAFAALDSADIYYKLGSFDKALPILQKAETKARHPTLDALLLDNIGIMQESLGHCDQAVTSWQKIADNPKMRFLQGRIFVQQGLCYEQLKDPTKAEQVYSKAESQMDDPQASREAKRYLKLLKITGQAG